MQSVLRICNQPSAEVCTTCLLASTKCSRWALCSRHIIVFTDTFSTCFYCAKPNFSRPVRALKQAIESISEGVQCFGELRCSPFTATNSLSLTEPACCTRVTSRPSACDTKRKSKNYEEGESVNHRLSMDMTTITKFSLSYLWRIAHEPRG